VKSLVLTIIGLDRPGLVERLSHTIAAHEASWQESRMSRLAGRFAGILRVQVPDPRLDSLEVALLGLEAEGLRVLVERSGDEGPVHEHRALLLELVGQDRPGIIRDVSEALAAREVNVIELESTCSSAPMAGEMLFTARARLSSPGGVSLDDLRETLEKIAHDLMVDLTLDEEPESSSTPLTSKRSGRVRRDG